MPQTVIFSERAYTALLTETLSEIKTETGGIFLGQHDNDVWYIIESIDPGPNSVFSSAYFEYNEAYVNHLANKIFKLYKNPLKIMGLWHRHPGSMDFFSSTDNRTHVKYANINTFGVISALVNIDPSFRLSIYSISSNKGRLLISKSKLNYAVGNDKIPNEFLQYKPPDLIKRNIDGYSAQSTENLRKIKLMENIITKTFNSNHDVIDIKNSISCSVPVNDEDIEKIVETLEEDISFFEKHGIQCGMSRGDDKIMWFFAEIEPGKKTCPVQIFKHNENIYIKNKNRIIIYGSGLFSEALN